MSYGVHFRVSGDFALFTRPEMKAERVSYEVPPASALRGIAEAIHLPGTDRPRPDAADKPPVRWEILKVAVLKPVRFASVRRNELGTTAPCDIEDDRQQRASLLLRDVEYVVHAAVSSPVDGADIPAPVAAKHLEIFKRRLKRGEQHFQPYLGCREFPARCEFAPPPWETYQRQAREANPGERPLGRMLREVRYAKARTRKGESPHYNAAPEWFVAVMRDGVVDFRDNGDRR